MTLRQLLLHRLASGLMLLPCCLCSLCAQCMPNAARTHTHGQAPTRHATSTTNRRSTCRPSEYLVVCDMCGDVTSPHTDVHIHIHISLSLLLSLSLSLSLSHTHTHTHTHTYTPSGTPCYNSTPWHSRCTLCTKSRHVSTLTRPRVF